MNEIVKLDMTVRSDADVAADLKKRMTELYQPILGLFDEATSHGLMIACTSGMGPIGRHVITNLTVMRPL